MADTPPATDTKHRKLVIVVPEVFGEHVSNDGLERYLLRTLPPSEMARVAGHLQVCDECQERLVGTDEFISAIRAALKILESRKVE